ncbi:unnamed protein product [Arctia plantaginis]|uniref:Uncharacterized protein n=1 Tax=Arctia plantaginis TaxID=874455 RepID=A0A8S0Z8N6_ARCPL|nr:unnamed protein product [Arctia plantaginis]
MPPLRVRPRLRPAHAGGLPCMGVRTLSLGRSDRTKLVTASINRWAAAVSFCEDVMLQKEAAERDRERGDPARTRRRRGRGRGR